MAKIIAFASLAITGIIYTLATI